MAVDQAAIDAAIQRNLTGPKEMAGDQGSMVMHSLKEQIEAKKDLVGSDAAGTTGLGVYFRKLVPPGAS